MTRILVTGGGTGGHVQPALAVIAELRKREPGVELLYVGSAKSVEASLVAEAGVPFTAVAVGKLRRSSKGFRGLFTAANATDAARVPVGVVQAFATVRRFKPDVVFGTGGYVSVPTIVASGLLRIPVLTHEQTVTIGLANRMAGRFATKIAVSFASSIAELPKSLQGRAIVTGNPLRKEIAEGSATSALDRFGFGNRSAGLPGVYVTGGAQGSRKVNHAVRDALPALLAEARVLHQCGEADAAEMQQFAETLSPNLAANYVVRPFVSRAEIGDAYAFADVVVGRAGAGTVSELAALGKPSVLVPLEPSSQNEQVRNAERLVELGASVMVRQSVLSGTSLLSALKPLLADAPKRAVMGQSLAPLATPNATGDLVEALFGLAR